MSEMQSVTNPIKSATGLRNYTAADVEGAKRIAKVLGVELSSAMAVKMGSNPDHHYRALTNASAVAIMHLIESNNPTAGNKFAAIKALENSTPEIQRNAKQTGELIRRLSEFRGHHNGEHDYESPRLPRRP